VVRKEEKKGCPIIYSPFSLLFDSKFVPILKNKDLLGQVFIAFAV